MNEKTPAPVGAAVALDLAEIEARFADATADEVIYELWPALVAEVRRLTGVRAECERQFQAQVGLVAAETTRAESAEAEVVTLRARLAEAEALHWKVGGACSHCSQRSDYAVAWPCETAVALAGTTGEGQ